MEAPAPPTQSQRTSKVIIIVSLIGGVAIVTIAASLLGTLGPRGQEGSATAIPTAAIGSPTPASAGILMSPTVSPAVSPSSAAPTSTRIPTSMLTTTPVPTAIPAVPTAVPTPVPTSTAVPVPANAATATEQAIADLNRAQQAKFEEEVRTKYRHDAETTSRLQGPLVASLERALRAIDEATSTENPDLPALKEALTGGELERLQNRIRRQKNQAFFVQMRYETRVLPDAYYQPEGDHSEVNGLIVWLDPSPSRVVFRQTGEVRISTADKPACVFLFFVSEAGTYKLASRAGLSPSFCEEKKS